MIPYIVHIQLCVAGQTILIFLNCIVCRKMWFSVTNQKKKCSRMAHVGANRVLFILIVGVTLHKLINFLYAEKIEN